MRQVSLVALHGGGASALRPLISLCRQELSRFCGARFAPYDRQQLHATVVGMETQPSTRLGNRNFVRHRGTLHPMDIRGYLRAIRGSGLLPFTLRFAGYGESARPFLSRGLSPYERSFSIQGDRVVLIGWPLEPRSDALVELRRLAERFGILHAYHRLPSDADNDAYLRLGIVAPDGLEDATARELESRVRGLLADRPPLDLQIDLRDLRLVDYDDETLPPHSTRSWTLQEALSDPTLPDSLFAAPG